MARTPKATGAAAADANETTDDTTEETTDDTTYENSQDGAGGVTTDEGDIGAGEGASGVVAAPELAQAVSASAPVDEESSARHKRHTIGKKSAYVCNCNVRFGEATHHPGDVIQITEAMAKSLGDAVTKK